MPIALPYPSSLPINQPLGRASGVARPPFGQSPSSGSTLGPFGVGAFGSGQASGNAAFGDMSGFDQIADPFAMMRANLDKTLAAQQARMAAEGAAPIPGMSGDPRNIGGGSTVGGAWAGVENWSNYINEANQLYGVPVNLLKSIMRLESSGDPGSVSPQQATGLMQIMPDWQGTQGYNIYDNRQNVLLGAWILKDAHDSWAARGAADPWQEAVRDYIGRGGADAFGTDQNSYWPVIDKYWKELNAAGGSSVGTPNAGPGGSILSLFPGANEGLPDWGSFNAPSGNGLYGYGTEYGLNGSNHTGVDVPMPFNSPYKAAFAGTVVCAGTNNGNGMDSCAAFNDTIHGGAGRVQIMSLDGNTMLIYGHSYSAAVRPGQQVTAGQVLGTSGGMNSDHIHLEARVRDSSTSSGWRLVDPSTVLGGGVSGGGTTPISPSIGSGAGSGSALPFWLRPGSAPRG